MKRLVMPLTNEQIEYLKPYDDMVLDACKRAGKDQQTMIIAQLYRGHAYVVHLESAEAMVLRDTMIDLEIKGERQDCPACGQTFNQEPLFCIEAEGK